MPLHRAGARRYGVAIHAKARVALALASLLLPVLMATTMASPAGAIHRGSDASVNSYRFMVSLRLADAPDSHRCGGTLIERDIVLTAAHCVARVPRGGLVAVVGADIPAWPEAPRVSTLGHRVPESFDFRLDNRDDVANRPTCKIADHPEDPFGCARAAGRGSRRNLRVGMYQRPTRLPRQGDQPPSLRSDRAP